MIRRIRKTIATVLSTLLMVITLGKLRVNRSGDATCSDGRDEAGISRELEGVDGENER